MDRWVDLNEPALSPELVDVVGLAADVGLAVEPAAWPGTFIGLTTGHFVRTVGISLRSVGTPAGAALRVVTGVTYNPTGVRGNDDLEVALQPLYWAEGCGLLMFDSEVCEEILAAPAPSFVSSNPALLPGCASRIACISHVPSGAAIGTRNGNFVQLVHGERSVRSLAIGYEIPLDGDVSVTLLASTLALPLVAEVLAINPVAAADFGGTPIWG